MIKERLQILFYKTKVGNQILDNRKSRRHTFSPSSSSPSGSYDSAKTDLRRLNRLARDSFFFHIKIGGKRKTKKRQAFRIDGLARVDSSVLHFAHFYSDELHTEWYWFSTPILPNGICIAGCCSGTSKRPRGFEVFSSSSHSPPCGWRSQSSIISGLSDLDSLTFFFFLSAQFYSLHVRGIQKDRRLTFFVIVTSLAARFFSFFFCSLPFRGCREFPLIFLDRPCLSIVVFRCGYCGSIFLEQVSQDKFWSFLFLTARVKCSNASFKNVVRINGDNSSRN